jgi:dGTPase
MLGFLRFPETESRGRRLPEPPPRYRSEFQRDRDRIVHSRAFRRLENKTQVFPPDLSDHVRNRLTHTIEVSQIARSVASVLGLNEDLTEALALAHDLGHPPFGHAGEAVLDREMRRCGERFDHNLHALRIVETFEWRYAAFQGLNLTFEVREGIVKHSRDPEPGEPGAEPYLPGQRPPLEAQLIDLADEAAYNTADLDDGFGAGLFTGTELREAVPVLAPLFEAVDRAHPDVPPKIRFLEMLRRVIDTLVSGLIEGTGEACRLAGVRTVAEVRHSPRRLVCFSPASVRLAQALKAFLHARVYAAPQLALERQRSMAQVAELFGFFVARPDRLPDSYRTMLHGAPVHRLVCDYIAGMTDGYFRRIYEQVFG